MSNKKPAQLVKPTRFETALDFSTPAAEEHAATEQAKASTNTIRLNADIPEELHKKIKIAAATKGVSIKDILVDLINKHL